MPNQLIQGTDAGYALLGPAIPKKIQKLQTGLTLGAYQRTGVVATGNEGPWRYATFFSQETVVTDAEGQAQAAAIDRRMAADPRHKELALMQAMAAGQL